MQLAERVRAAQLPPAEERKAIRLAARVTFGAMGAELRVSGVTVLRWEQGTRTPAIEHAIAYRRLLDQLKRATR